MYTIEILSIHKLLNTAVCVNIGGIFLLFKSSHIRVIKLLAMILCRESKPPMLVIMYYLFNDGKQLC